MTKEQRQPSPEGFAFTENEELFYRVTDQRLRQMLFDESTTIHQFIISSNNYGEFAFITASRPAGEGRDCHTFWGLGEHESRERWLTDEWFFHRANQFPDTMKQELTHEEAEALLQERREDIAPYVTTGDQSRRGKLFEMLAYMLDEDGATSELEDLGDLFFDDLEDW
jgi:hypothetical protein